MADVFMSVSVTCGHCGTDLVNEEGDFYCSYCNVIWPDTDPFDESAPAAFLDPESAPCGAERADGPYSDVMPHRGFTYRAYYNRCDLPADHGMGMWGHNHPHHIITCEESR